MQRSDDICCGISITKALGIPQSCAKPSVYDFQNNLKLNMILNYCLPTVHVAMFLTSISSLQLSVVVSSGRPRHLARFHTQKGTWFTSYYVDRFMSGISWVAVSSGIIVNKGSRVFIYYAVKHLKNYWGAFQQKQHIFQYSLAILQRYRKHCQIKTHLPLVPHICVSESGQHWFR